VLLIVWSFNWRVQFWFFFFFPFVGFDFVCFNFRVWTCFISRKQCINTILRFICNMANWLNKSLNKSLFLLQIYMSTCRVVIPISVLVVKLLDFGGGYPSSSLLCVIYICLVSIHPQPSILLWFLLLIVLLSMFSILCATLCVYFWEKQTVDTFDYLCHVVTEKDFHY
jgi:hypothetical protein